MKVIIYVVLFIGAMLLAIFLLGERSRAQKNGGLVYHKITTGEAKKKVQDTKNFILLDVCTQGESLEQRIPGATLVVDNQISTEAGKRLPDKNIPIFVYCRSRRHSTRAADQLVNMGYTQIYDFGGIID